MQSCELLLWSSSLRTLSTAVTPFGPLTVLVCVVAALEQSIACPPALFNRQRQEEHSPHVYEINTGLRYS